MDRVERELTIAAPPDEVWEAITASGWLAEEVELELTPGGEATFRDDAEERHGWVEDVQAPDRLIFWWAAGEEPASRVELTLRAQDELHTRLRVIETRPLEVLDLVGLPLRRAGGATFGPALVAA